jgi:hypothetical protein
MQRDNGEHYRTLSLSYARGEHEKPVTKAEARKLSKKRARERKFIQAKTSRRELDLQMQVSIDMDE